MRQQDNKTTSRDAESQSQCQSQSQSQCQCQSQCQSLQDNKTTRQQDNE